MAEVEWVPRSNEDSSSCNASNVLSAESLPRCATSEDDTKPKIVNFHV